MDSFDKILLENKAWSEEKKKDDPSFFERMVNTQKPEFLWIGCSDSRVATNEITNTDPGEIFVHRNIANLVLQTDLNLLSVLQYAVEVLEVKIIIVCGHYQCGGIRAAIEHKDLGLINKWLRNIKETYSKNRKELEKMPKEDMLNRLTELNIIEQTMNLAKTTIIQKSWAKKEMPLIYGCVYSLQDGILHEITRVDKNSDMDPIFRYEFDSPKE
jgi:carbonic anhydrase